MSKNTFTIYFVRIMQIYKFCVWNHPQVRSLLDGRFQDRHCGGRIFESLQINTVAISEFFHVSMLNLVFGIFNYISKTFLALILDCVPHLEEYSGRDRKKAES